MKAHSHASHRLLAVLLVWLVPQPGPAAADGPHAADTPAYVIDHSHSPQAALRPLPFDAVQWTEGFWAERHRQLVEVTLDESWRLLADPAKGHVLDNFRFATRPGTGEYVGDAWQDEWLYKWLEAAACVCRNTREPALARRMDEAIALIAAAQQPDGYISTKILVKGAPRFAAAGDHELYNMGHLLTAGVIHHRMTGRDNLLQIARRAADFICASVGTTVKPYFTLNPSVLMGLVEFHRLTGEEKYLACARLIVDSRGAEPQPGSFWGGIKTVAGTDVIQDRTPIRKSTEIVGHNVFFTYLYTGAADTLAEKPDAELGAALDRLWSDLTNRRMFIHGGISAIPMGLSRKDIVWEAAGEPYQLPNGSCYNETCGQVGVFMWGYRQLTNRPDAGYTDIMEREMFNGFLPSIGLGGKSWFYRAILRRYDEHHQSTGGTDLVERIPPGRKMICCPSNLLRTLAQLSSYFYSLDGDGLWIHHYGGTKVDCTLATGEPFTFEQITGYPWSGDIRLALSRAPGKPVALRLRIPGWAASFRLTVNDREISTPVERGYVTIKRVWNAGDTLRLSLPMSARLVTADPYVEEARNQVAVMHGPVLYCAESSDLPAGVGLPSVLVPSDATFQPGPGVAGLDLPLAKTTVTLHGPALQRADAHGGPLYRPVETGTPRPFGLTLIPYYAWANRGRSAMSVWLPVAWRTGPARAETSGPEQTASSRP